LNSPRFIFRLSLDNRFLFHRDLNYTVTIILFSFVYTSILNVFTQIRRHFAVSFGHCEDRRRSVRLTAASASSGRRAGSDKISVAVHRYLKELRTAENDIFVKIVM